jgi:hypothetical protein
MGHKWLSYLLIVMIAMQSLLAVAADPHQSHQNGIQHLEFEHQHDTEVLNRTPEMDKERYAFAGEDYDCHHCCHCHHMSHLGLLSGNDRLTVALPNEKAMVFQFDYLSKQLSPELRPPIAQS